MLPDILVVDASILFSFFEKDSARRGLIEVLPLRGSRLISPKFAFTELLDIRERIMRYAKIDESEFLFLFSLIERKIDSFPEEKYGRFLMEAAEISPHGEDTKDDAYFALALAFNCPIWSDEEAFKKQDKVKILTTEDVVKLLGF